MNSHSKSSPPTTLPYSYSSFSWWQLFNKIKCFPLPLIFEYSLHLMPIILISVALHLRSETLTQISLASTNLKLNQFMLVVALTVPWLSQAGCLALYVSLGHELFGQGRSQLPTRLLSDLPGPWLTSTLIGFVAGVLFGKSLHWNQTIILFFTLSLSLHVLLNQLMVYGNIIRCKNTILFTSIIYSALIFSFPTSWYLPPLGGIFFNGLILFSKINKMTFPSFNFLVGLKYLIQGILIGLFFWIDKILFFIMNPSSYQIHAVFFSLIPSILVINYFNIVQSPILNKLYNEIVLSFSCKNIQHFLTIGQLAANQIKTIFRNTILLNFLLTLIFYMIFNFLFSHGEDPMLIKKLFFSAFSLSIGNVVLSHLLFLKAHHLFYFYSLFYLLAVLALFLLVKGPDDSRHLHTLLSLISLIGACFLIKQIYKKWSRPHFLVLKMWS